MSKTEQQREQRLEIRLPNGGSEQQGPQLGAALQELEKPDWIFWATFVGGAIAAIASVIFLLLGLSWID